MISVGIDPGTFATGLVALEAAGGSARPRVLAITTLEGRRKARKAERLASIMSLLEGALLRIRPDVVVVEAGSVHRFARAALVVSEARGVALALGERAGARVYECHIQSCRKALGVSGFAQRRDEGKRAVAKAVGAILGIHPGTQDEADAAALAWWGILHGRSMIGVGG